jgi:hypothetical protein
LRLSAARDARGGNPSLDPRRPFPAESSCGDYIVSRRRQQGSRCSNPPACLNKLI